MKNLCAGAVLGLVGLLASASISAQTCTSPGPVALTGAGTGTIDLCADGSNFATKFCVFNNNPSNDYAFTFTLAGGYTATQLTLTNVGGGWTPQLVIQKACGSTSDCTSTATAAGTTAGSATSVTLTDSSNSGAALAAGTYFVVVSGSGATANCGTFSLATNGTLPVKLSEFSVD